MLCPGNTCTAPGSCVSGGGAPPMGGMSNQVGRRRADSPSGLRRRSRDLLAQREELAGHQQHALCGRRQALSASRRQAAQPAAGSSRRQWPAASGYTSSAAHCSGPPHTIAQALCARARTWSGAGRGCASAAVPGYGCAAVRCGCGSCCAAAPGGPCRDHHAYPPAPCRGGGPVGREECEAGRGQAWARARACSAPLRLRMGPHVLPARRGSLGCRISAPPALPKGSRPPWCLPRPWRNDRRQAGRMCACRRPGRPVLHAGHGHQRGTLFWSLPLVQAALLRLQLAQLTARHS